MSCNKFSHFRQKLFLSSPTFSVTASQTTLHLTTTTSDEQALLEKMGPLHQRVSPTSPPRKGSKSDTPEVDSQRFKPHAIDWSSPAKPSRFDEPTQALRTTAQEPADTPPGIWDTAARRVRRQRTSGLGEMFRNQIVQRAVHQWLPRPPAPLLPPSGQLTGAALCAQDGALCAASLFCKPKRF
jgi:hypothetical protein